MSKSIIQEIESLVARLSNVLLIQGKTFAVAESCTGGWLAKMVTDLEGSSAWFLGGVVSYSNESKNKLLGVPMNCINEYGAVSEQVAEFMVDGVQKVFLSTVSVSITGIAGPLGGTKDKPVGLVCFGVKHSKERVKLRQQVFKGDRNDVRLQAVKMALLLVIEEVAV
ncbi:MAG: damage-inducible protein CinA [Cycloclasticus sp. symbiont of Bathymodiolus heckerae]|nr:MAG: damage-inducible protein CinA [Cycloclasticus sp. symbiont of Bathymodiolus heckerae]